MTDDSKKDTHFYRTAVAETMVHPSKSDDSYYNFDDLHQHHLKCRRRLGHRIDDVHEKHLKVGWTHPAS